MMITCGVEIKGSEAILCLLSKQDGLFQIADCRQIRHALSHPNDSESFRKYQFTLKKLFEDYNVSQVVIRERPTKGKFAGGAIGFKIEAALQLMTDVDVKLMHNSDLKETLKHNPLPIPFSATGLKVFQENAFLVGYAALCDKN